MCFDILVVLMLATTNFLNASPVPENDLNIHINLTALASGGGQDRIGAGLVEIGAGQAGRGQYGEAVDHAGGGLGQFPRERVQFARGDLQQYATGGGGKNLPLPESQPVETGTDYKYGRI